MFSMFFPIFGHCPVTFHLSKWHLLHSPALGRPTSSKTSVLSSKRAPISVWAVFWGARIPQGSGWNFVSPVAIEKPWKTWKFMKVLDVLVDNSWLQLPWNIMEQIGNQSLTWTKGESYGKPFALQTHHAHGSWNTAMDKNNQANRPHVCMSFHGDTQTHGLVNVLDDRCTGKCFFLCVALCYKHPFIFFD